MHRRIWGYWWTKNRIQASNLALQPTSNKTDLVLCQEKCDKQVEGVDYLHLFHSPEIPSPVLSLALEPLTQPARGVPDKGHEDDQGSGVPHLQGSRETL